MLKPTKYCMVKDKAIEFIEKRLGAFPSPPDPRHYRLRVPTYSEVVEIPDEYTELLDVAKKVYDKIGAWPDQGDVGSCVGWDGNVVMELTNYLLDLEYDDISAGWLYVRSRFYANIPEHLEGSTNLGLMKALHKEGAATEDCVPTDTKAPFDEYDPCVRAYEIAAKYAIDSYWMVNKFPNDIKAAIYGVTHRAPYNMPDGSQGKIPLVTAYPVYESFREGYDDGIVPEPKPGERLLGGHSSCVVGWRKIDGETHWINVNSWGDDVGDGGVFYLPENYPFYDIWLVHNGPPTEPTPSNCVVGGAVAGVFNVVAKLLRRRGRFYYMNPSEVK